MSFVSDIVGGIGSIIAGATTDAPKINTKGVVRSFSTPFYNLKRGVLTPTAAAASPAGFGSVMGGLQQNQGSILDLRKSLQPIGSTLGNVSNRLTGYLDELRP